MVILRKADNMLTLKDAINLLNPMGFELGQINKDVIGAALCAAESDKDNAIEIGRYHDVDTKYIQKEIATTRKMIKERSKQ